MTKRKISKGITKSGGNIPVVASIIVLVAFIAGLLLGSLVIVKAVGGKNILISQMTGSFADGYNAAKKIINDSGFFPHQGGTVSGRITAVNGNEIAFSSPLINPLDDQSLKNRIAVAGKDTVITVYHLKSADQLAADQKTGQKEMADLQSQISSMQKEISKCSGAPITVSPGSDCQTVMKNYSTAQQQLNQASELMNIYSKSDNASVSDLKVGMQVTVFGEQTNPANNQKATSAPAIAAVNFADISGKTKFNVSLIQAWEVASGPVVPASPHTAPVVPSTSTSAQ